MIVLPNLGLVKWDLTNDLFSHDQLAANFQSLDDHDHTSGKGKQIPAGGLAPLSVSAANLQDSIFSAEKIASSAVTSDKIANSAVTDSKLASANNSVYREVYRSSSWIGTDAVAGTYLMLNGVAISSGDLYTSGTGRPTSLFYFAANDYAVTSKTLKLRLRTAISANATAPAINFTFGLRPITVAGAADTLTFALGAAVASSTVTITTPTASNTTTGLSADFSAPADGPYALAVVTSGTIANNSVALATSCLQIHHV